MHTFGAPVSYPGGSTDSYVASADLDGDGKPEILAANTQLDKIVIYQNLNGVAALPAHLTSFTGHHQ